MRWRKHSAEVPPLGTRETLCNWVSEGDDAPMIDMVRYSDLLTRLPDKVVTNLERARLARDGRYPMLKAGLGYVELLAAIIVDGTAISSSSSEAKLAPALVIPANYMQPGGIPGRTLRISARGRGTTIITTAATMTIRFRIAATDIITGTVILASGAMAADAAVQTATMWSVDAEINVRSVGSAGTVFGMGEASLSWHFKDTAAKQALQFMGSAGSATPAAATWDMTVSQFFQFTGQWSLATAYSIQCHQYQIEALN